MKPLSSHSRIGHDTTPATHGDLEIWGGRLIEKIDESAEEVKTELKADISATNKRLDKMTDRQDSMEERLIRIEDKQNDMYLLVKSIEKKVSKK